MQPAAVQVTEVVALNDAKRVRDARAGDVRAFEAIARAALPGAYRLASAILGSEADAADATQNALVAAWRELPRLREATSFEPWFHRILVNECRMQVRRRGRAREVPLGDDGNPDARGAALAAPTLDRVEVMDLLEGAFEELDPDDRAMVVMHHLEDRPLGEIAACMHMPVGTVKWRLHEARQTLQRALEGLG
jgi:RNA polymerase sigma-70 factor (ECF subfamily)